MYCDKSYYDYDDDSTALFSAFCQAQVFLCKRRIIAVTAAVSYTLMLVITYAYLFMTWLHVQ